MTPRPVAGGSPAALEDAGGRERLFNRDFLLLWQGQLVSQVGDQAFLVAVMFWTMEATGSATLMGVLMAALSLPAVLLGPVAGTVADRHSRKAIIVGGDAVRGLAVLAAAWLFVAVPAPDARLAPALLLVALVYGVVGAVFKPAVNAAVPDLVPASRIPSANSLNQLSGRGSALVGQALGGVLYAGLGAPLLLVADGLSYLLSASSEAFIRLPRNDSTSDDGHGAARGLRGYLADSADGFRFVWGWTGMRSFVLTAAGLNFLFMPAFVLLPFYVTDVLGRGAGWYGFLLASLSAGSIVGLLVAGTTDFRGRRRATLLGAALLAVGGSTGALAVVTTVLPAAAILFTLGLLTGLMNVFVITLVQIATPARMRGRALALVIALTGAASPLGMALGGVLGDLVPGSVRLVYLLAGGAMLLLVTTACVRPDFRAFLATDVALQAD